MNEIEHIFKKLFVFPLLWTVCSHPLLIFPLGCWSSIFYDKNFIQGKFNLRNVNPLWYELQITFFFLHWLFAFSYGLLHPLFAHMCVLETNPKLFSSSQQRLQCYGLGLAKSLSLSHKVSAGLTCALRSAGGWCPHSQAWWLTGCQ